MAATGGVVVVEAHGKPPTRPERAQEDDQVDEKVLRRRMQYKFHQRHHRAKQKEKVVTLTREVQALLAEIEQLNHKRQRLLVERNCFASRGTGAGVPARLTMEYFQLFEYGISPKMAEQQEQFLRSIMTAETAGPDYAGVDTVIMLWKRFSDFYVYSRYQLLSMDVSTVGDSTVVVMETNFHISCRRDGVLTLYPSLGNHTELLQRYRFQFDSNGIVTWFSADWDLVSALNTVGSIVDAACILADANISKTGQIRTTIDDIRPPSSVEPEISAPVDPRHSVDFLLS